MESKIKKVIIVMFVLFTITLVYAQFNNGPVIPEIDSTFEIGDIYGEMYTHEDAGVSFPVAESEIYYNASFNSSGIMRGFTMNTPANETMTADYSGLYLINYHGSGSGIPNHNYHMSVSINGITKFNTETHFRVETPTDVVTLSGSGIFILNSGDEIGLQIEDSTGTGTATIYSINVNAVRIGE